MADENDLLSFLREQNAPVAPSQYQQPPTAPTFVQPAFPPMPPVTAQPMVDVPVQQFTAPAIEMPAQQGITPEQLTALLEAGKAEFHVTPTSKAVTSPEKQFTVPAAQTALINQMLAQANQLKDIKSEAEAKRAQITDFLGDLLGDNEELVVNGAVVFTNKEVVARVVDTDYIKATFPDDDSGFNDEFYKETRTKRRLFK